MACSFWLVDALVRRRAAARPIPALPPGDDNRLNHGAKPSGRRAGAALAAANQLQISGHCAPNLHAHVAAAVPNLRHVEYFHDHQRIERMLFDGTLDPHGGTMHPDPGRAGHGMTLRDTDAELFRVPA